MVAVYAIVGSNEPLGVRFNETSVHCYKVMGIYTEGKNAFCYVCIQKFKVFCNYKIFSYSPLTYK